jgi:hypothetical protein
MAGAQWTAAEPGLGDIRKMGLSVFGLGPLQVYSTPGWEDRARDVARLLAESFSRLASLTGARPPVWLAVLNSIHWQQLASLYPYPAPAARWEGSSGTVIMPDSYPTSYLRDQRLPEAVSVWDRWPPSLAQVGEPARLTALADLLAVQELAHLFLQDLQVVPTDPRLGRLLAAYLTEVVLHGRQGEGARELAGAWEAWGRVLADAGTEVGKTRQQAADLYASHGDGLVESFVGRRSELEQKVSAALTSAGPRR